MGVIYTELTLVNAGQSWAARQGLLEEKEVKRIEVNALVDSGAYQMFIPKHIANQLDLEVMEKREVEYANSELKIADVLGPLKYSSKTEERLPMYLSWEMKHF